jgi:hypothetical protein
LKLKKIGFISINCARNHEAWPVSIKYEIKSIFRADVTVGKISQSIGF